jgi:hypothetical protein
MKPNFWLTVVCWALVGLLLSLSQQADLYHSLQVSGSSQWLDQCREPASGSRTASVSKARNSIRLVLDRSHLWSSRMRGLMEILVHPGQENHGPPEPIRICRLPVKDGSSKQEQAAFPRKL